MILNREFNKRGDTIRFPAKQSVYVYVPINKAVSAALYRKQGKDPRRWTLPMTGLTLRVKPSFTSTGTK